MTKKRTKKKEQYQIKIVNLNNKSRKGLHVRIKDQQAKRYTYYKIQDVHNDRIEYYIERYKLAKNKPKLARSKKFQKEAIDIFKIKESKIRRKKRKYFEKTYKTKIKRLPKIGVKITKGKVTKKYSIDQLQRNPTKVYKDLLSPLILDKRLLNATIENIHKLGIKNLFEYQTHLQGHILDPKDKSIYEGRLGIIQDVNKTIHEYIEKYTKKFKTEQTYYRSDFIETDEKKKFLGYQWAKETPTQSMNRYYVKKWDIIISFTKTR